MSLDRELHDLSYIAGLFDGEGCVSMYMHKEGYVHLHVQITNQDEPLLDWVSTIFDGYKAFDGHTSFVWRPHNKREFLQTILPYLKTKKDQVTHALEYLDWTGDGKVKHGRGEQAMLTKQGYVDRCKFLNKRLSSKMKTRKEQGKILH